MWQSLHKECLLFVRVWNSKISWLEGVRMGYIWYKGSLQNSSILWKHRKSNPFVSMFVAKESAGQSVAGGATFGQEL